jgi:Mrp family chromosome partitioning ATPase/DUF971 family protein
LLSCNLAMPCTAHVKLVPRVHSRPEMGRVGAGMAGVGSIVAVASGKGGVGKSTVAVNLAFALARSGARVGIFDADIYGPSLPLMVSPSSVAVVKRADGFITPLTMNNVQLMSYGYVSPRNKHGERGGAVLRGPMVSQIVSQLCRFTDWGSLDHLIVDMPPGTGDIHITLGQTLPFTAAVIVSTPQALALADVRKGLDMFTAMRVPATAIVLNMAYFDAPDTGTRYFPFGSFASDVGASVAPLAELAQDHGIRQFFTLPIDQQLSTTGNGGTPVVMSDPDGATTSIYSQLAACVADAAELRAWSADMNVGSATPAATDPIKVPPQLPKKLTENSQPVDEQSIHYSAKIDNKHGNIIFREFSSLGAREWVLDSFAVRMACRCAACVDEVSGELRIKAGSVPNDLRAVSLTQQGNYGVQIVWSDKHATGIFSYNQLQALTIAQRDSLQ